MLQQLLFLRSSCPSTQENWSQAQTEPLRWTEGNKLLPEDREGHLWECPGLLLSVLAYAAFPFVFLPPSVINSSQVPQNTDLHVNSSITVRLEWIIANNPLFYYSWV